MSAYKIGSYTSAKGGVYQTVSGADAATILGKALGLTLGKIGVLPSGEVLLFAPKAPKGKDSVTEAKRKGIPAAPVSTLNPAVAAMQAQLDALMAMMTGKAAQAPDTEAQASLRQRTAEARKAARAKRAA